MKVLLITSSCPPNSGSHTQRIIPMMNTLVENGVDLHVLSVDIPHTHPFYDEKLLSAISPKIHVYRSPQGVLHKKAYGSFRKESSQKYKKYSPDHSLKNWIFKQVDKYKDVFLYPDAMVDWYFSALKYIRKIRLIETIRPDVVLACSMPEVAHLIGNKIAQKYSIPLYLDTADPWTYIGNYQERQKTLRFKLDKYFEGKIVNKAIGISFSAPGCTELYIDKFNLREDKCISIVTGFEERIAKLREEHIHSVRNSESILLTYGGALQEYVRDPKPFFHAISNFDCLEASFRTDQVEKVTQWANDAGIAGKIKVNQYIRFEDYFKEMLDSDIVLFFGNNNNIQLPGKIFNFIATGKYIYYIKSNNVENDTVETILKAYGRCYVSENNEASICRTLKQIITDIAKLRGTDVNIGNQILQFSSSHQFGMQYQHIKECLIRYGNKKI